MFNVKKYLLFLLICINTFDLSKEAKSEQRTLVLLDDWHYVDTHSMFWEQIKKMGQVLDFKMVDDPEIKLTYFGEYIYNNIIFVAPSYNEDLSKKNDILVQNLLKFIDDGHDIMVFGSQNVGSFLRKFVNEFGVDFDDYVNSLI